MNILVIGGLHGNEKLGLELANLLKRRPIENVSSVLANKEAIAKNCRFIKQDLNRSFPGDIKNIDYEQRRAAQLLKLASKYDIVLDFHSTSCPDNNCCFVGEDANNNLYDIAGQLGLNRVVIADYDCINKYAVNCLSVEISINDKLDDLEFWYDQISKLSKLTNPETKSNIQKYKFVYRITNEDRDNYNLNNKKLTAFKELEIQLAKKLGVTSPAYPIFINDKFTPYNYGGILNKI